MIIKFLLDWCQPDRRLNVLYLKILMGNEQKLPLDIEHHDNSYFWKSDNIISIFFRDVWNEKYQNKNYSLTCEIFLSYGAFIFQTNLDDFYRFSLNKNCDFLNILLYMDSMSNDNRTELGPLYFHYDLEPDINKFVNCIWSNVILIDDYYNFGNTYLSYLNYTMPLFRIPGNCKESLHELRTSLDHTNDSFEPFIQFPSLVQLSRDVALFVHILRSKSLSVTYSCNKFRYSRIFEKYHSL